MKIYIHESDNRYPLKPISEIYVKCGVYLDGGTPMFDFDEDYPEDILTLHEDCSGEYDDDGVKYVYAYSYRSNADKKQIGLFRNYIKGKYSDLFSTNDEVRDFVEAGVLKLGDYVPFDSFGAIVNIQPTKIPALVNIIRDQLEYYINHIEFDFTLVKQTYENVSFDAEKAANALRKFKYSESRIMETIEKVLQEFDALKKTGRLFEMKKFLPVAIREGFTDYLVFQSDEEKNIYQSLQGTNVLIYDDLITSGSTVKEVIRYLRAINDKNTLTVFILVKQH